MLSSKKHFCYSQFVKRIIAIKAQLFWAWSDYRTRLDIVPMDIGNIEVAAGDFLIFA